MKSELIRCTRCVLSERFPNIQFNEDGICQFCDHEEKGGLRSEQLAQMCKKIASTVEKTQKNAVERDHDVLLCFSGGKDSTYTLKLLLEKYHLRVITFTMDNGFLSADAFKNIKHVTDCLGVDHITERPPQSFISKLYMKSAFEDFFVGDSLTRASAICSSCRMTFTALAVQTAVERSIPLIAAGYSRGQIPGRSVVYQVESPINKEANSSLLSRLEEKIGPEVRQYMQVSTDKWVRSSARPVIICPMAAEEVSEEEVLKEVRKMGWILPSDTDLCSTNCRMNGFAIYNHRLRHGFHPYEHELSQLVRSGTLPRRVALEKLDENVDLDAIRQVARELAPNDSAILDRLSLTGDESDR